MRNEQTVADLVERIVRESGIPSAGAREELRRELIAHFEDAGNTPEALRVALERFGSTNQIVEGLRRAYGPGRVVLYGMKVVASIAASAAVALGVQAIVNVRFEPGTGALLLGPWYGTSALISLVLVIVAAAAWELSIEPLCARLERRPARLLIIFAAFSVGAYVTHAIIDRLVEPSHALIGSAATIAVWVSTIAILARFELAFIRRFGSA